jgi:hypothetical protein
MFYVAISILGFILGFVLGKDVSHDNLNEWIKFLVVAVPISLAIQQSISVRRDLGEIKKIEGLTSSERRRLVVIVTTLQKESVIGLLACSAIPFAIVYSFIKLTPSFTVGFVVMLWFFSAMLLVRMFHYNAKQIEDFNAYVKNRAEDNKRKKDLLGKLQSDKKDDPISKPH